MDVLFKIKECSTICCTIFSGFRYTDILLQLQLFLFKYMTWRTYVLTYWHSVNTLTSCPPGHLVWKLCAPRICLFTLAKKKVLNLDAIIFFVNWENVATVIFVFVFVCAVFFYLQGQILTLFQQYYLKFNYNSALCSNTNMFCSR